MPGPLAGLRIVEVGGIGPGPFAGMMLADLGAEVVRVDRIGGMGTDRDSHVVLLRGRRSVTADLKDPRGRELVRRLAARSDGLIEGFRPGVMERLELGPEVLLAANPALVYGRMTGWGQTGPWARRAGHDINYVAAAGALEPIAGPDLSPVPPLNMLGDFGGGGMLLACGMLAALLRARESGAGQVVDASIVDGTALLTAMLHAMRATGGWAGERGRNLFDGGAPFYGVFATSDDHWLSLGAVEPQFHRALMAGLGIEPEAGQYDTAAWPALRARVAERVAERPMEHWLATFADVDACVAEAIAPDEVTTHPHLAARGVFTVRDGVTHPAPAPRFSGTPLSEPGPVPDTGADTRVVLRELGYPQEEIDALLGAGVIGAVTAAVP
jgi:alpha-methylacyl-CoA racemase